MHSDSGSIMDTDYVVKTTKARVKTHKYIY